MHTTRPPHRFLHRHLIALTAISLGLLGPSAWAEKADKAKPMNAEADALRYDDVKQTSVFTGNVVITKGSMVIRGAQIEVREDPEGFQMGTATEKNGKRAFYRQKRDVPDEWIEGEAETIFYDGKADTVTFTKNAVLRRYKGTAVNDETTGNQIIYDNITAVFNVVGGAANASVSNPTGRIRAMITPKAASSAPRPAAPPPASLRPSTSIGEERK
jgi:lipopolysaccharide export system protein LptA